MRIVTTTTPFDCKIGFKDSVRLICEAGFEGIDLSTSLLYGDDYRETVSEMSAAAAAYGVPFVQAHGPIPHYKYGDGDGRAEFMHQARRSLEIAGMLGIENVIFHPMRLSVGSHADQLAMNLSVYGELIPLAEKYDTHIAIENMCGYKVDGDGNQVKHVCKSSEELVQYVDAFGSSRVVACLDTGHAFISGEAPGEFARMLGCERLRALHVHDSDGLSDLHTLPYFAGIEWDSFIRELRAMGYRGDLTLEAVNFTRSMPSTLFASALRFMRDTAASIRDAIVGAEEPPRA